jgi:hypothetical protein
MMNRDTWKDEVIMIMIQLLLDILVMVILQTLISLLQSSFVFWQRGHTSEEGLQFMMLYGIQETSLPHIAIIDSRTGVRVVALTVSLTSL